jgi:hypothetical protein
MSRDRVDFLLIGHPAPGIVFARRGDPACDSQDVENELIVGQFWNILGENE